jgi:hypothetical protein
LNVAFRHYASVKPNVTYINTIDRKRSLGPKIKKQQKPLLKTRTHDQERQRRSRQPQTATSLPSQEGMREVEHHKSFCLPVSQLDIPECCCSFLPEESCVPAFCGNQFVLTNETLLPPVSSHCFRQTGLRRAVCSLSCTTVVRSRVMAGVDVAVGVVACCLLFIVFVMFMLREAYFLSPPSMPPTMGRLLSLLLPSLPFFLSSPPRPKAPRSLLTPRPPSRPLTRPPRPRPLSS